MGWGWKKAFQADRIAQAEKGLEPCRCVRFFQPLAWEKMEATESIYDGSL